MSKWQLVLESRKFWAAVVSVSVLFGLWMGGYIGAETVAWGTTLALGIFTGSVAVEDGLSALFAGLGDVMVLEPSKAPSGPPASPVAAMAPAMGGERSGALDGLLLLGMIEQRWPAGPNMNHHLHVDDEGRYRLTLCWLDRWREIDLSEHMDAEAGEVAAWIGVCLAAGEGERNEGRLAGESD